MKLIFGLGNPGKEYDNTRHNVGFNVIDYIVENDELVEKNKFNALCYEEKIENEKVIFVKPLSFMNLSGTVVRKYMDFYKVPKEDIVVIQDDLDMEVGKIKLMYGHTDGGHNGIKSINQEIGSNEYLRVRIGISNDKARDTKDYVLGKFTKGEELVMKETYDKLIDIATDFVLLDQKSLIQLYNTNN